MSVRMSAPAAARRSSGLLCLIAAGLLWGPGGLTGTLLGRVAGLSPMAIAAYRLTAGGTLIMVFLTVTARHRVPTAHRPPPAPAPDPDQQPPAKALRSPPKSARTYQNTCSAAPVAVSKVGHFRHFDPEKRRTIPQQVQRYGRPPQRALPPPEARYSLDSAVNRGCPNSGDWRESSPVTGLPAFHSSATW